MNARWIGMLAMLPALVAAPCATAGGLQGRKDLLQALSRVDTAPLHVAGARLTREVLEVTLAGDWSSLRGNDEWRERIVRDILWAGRSATGKRLEGIRVYVETAEGRKRLDDLLHDPSEDVLVRKLRQMRPRSPSALRALPPQDLPLGGSLVGKTIVISPGHGWLYYDSLANWSTQRGLINTPGCDTCTGIIEDFSNAEIAFRYLVPNLLRAGATVWAVREPDFSDDEIILDEDSPSVVEQGNWRDGTSPGGYLDDYRVLLASDGGSITYPLTPPQAGHWWLSVWYVAGQNRVSDARYTVRRGGTEYHFSVDQRQNGSRWIHLGLFYLDPASAPELVVSPGPGAEPDHYAVADAVRLGGGIDHTVVAGKSADKPRWQMGALYTLPYFGLPDSANTGSDVTIRPAYAEWQGADAYLSLHSNASGGSTSSASGTSTYRYNCSRFPDHSPAPDPSQCDDPPGSDALQKSVHGAIIEFLRAHWDPNWRDRGTLVANFGEVRVLDSIPGVLVESAFHDGTEKASPAMRMPDNMALQDPRFRHWLGYALYAGLARFFDPGVTLLPALPPENLSVTHAASGGLLVQWGAVEGAEAYRVRWSPESRGLERSLVTTDTSAVIEGIEPGQLVAVQVSALNPGGEGPPSELAAARYRGNGTFADVLLVGAFDRQDPYIGDGRNRRDQCWSHALAISAIADRNIYFDFASNEAVEGGRVPLEAYRAVVWILGEESTEHETFSEAEQSVVAAYLDAGGGLFASGAEIGWDLVEKGSASDKAFFGGAFGANYVSDDAETYSASGAGMFTALGDFSFDDGSAGIYPVEYPDVFSENGGTVVLQYPDGTGAAVAFERNPGRSIIVGFPAETITSADARRDLIAMSLAWLMPGHTPDDYDSDGLPDDWEYEHGTDPQRPSAGEDPDGDGLTNAEEYDRGTDPQVPDNQEGGESPDGGADGGADGDVDGGVDGGVDGRTDGSNGEGGEAVTKVVGKGCACSSGGQRKPANLASLLLLLYVVSRRRLPRTRGSSAARAVAKHRLPFTGAIARRPEFSIPGAKGLPARKLFLSAARSLGAEITSDADASARFKIFPKMSADVLLWLADDEFPARVSILMDSGLAEHYPVEGSADVTNLLVRRLVMAARTGISR